MYKIKTDHSYQLINLSAMPNSFYMCQGCRYMHMQRSLFHSKTTLRIIRNVICTIQWKTFCKSQQLTNFLSISHFCDMRLVQQCEVCFILFCIRIEVSILILQYFKRSSSLSSIVRLYINDKHGS